ncbi:hypothetical protein D3C77_438320 [compost metagenome]
MNVFFVFHLTNDKASYVLVRNFNTGHVCEIYLDDVAAYRALHNKRQPDQRPFDVAVLLKYGGFLLFILDHGREEDFEQLCPDFIP